MKEEKLDTLKIKWKRGSGLRKADLNENGKYKCILYGELYTKHKSVQIESSEISQTNKDGKVHSKKGDILVPGTSTAAKKDMLLAREIDEDGVIIGGDINIIRPEKRLFAKKYLPYYFETFTAYDQLDRYITGATGIIHISNKGLKNLKVPIPPLPEQQRIVSILDQAFAAIDKAKTNAEQNLQNAKELFESYLQGVFENGDWETKKLGSLCDLITKGSSPKWQGINYVDEPGILFVTSENVGEGELLLGKRKYVEEKFNQKDKKSILKNGDVLTNIVGASIGRTAIYNIDDVANINQAVCLLRCNPELVNNRFLMNLLNSPFLKAILHDNEVNTARANLSLGFFKQLEIPCPTIEEQQTIVRQLDALRTKTQKLEAIYQKKIDDLEELKKSILEKAFAGKLDTSVSSVTNEKVEAV